MSDHFADLNTWNTWIPITVLLASLIGSAHCVGMCGGLVLNSVKDRSSWIGYHSGRLIGYLLLGALAGAFGDLIFRQADQKSAWLEYSTWVAAFLVAVIFLVSGIRTWQGRSVHLPTLPPTTLSKAFKKAGKQPCMTGFLTAFLPCGWLHSFILGAIATQNALSGGLFLFAFWLGTLPALGMAPWLVNKFFKESNKLTKWNPRMTGRIAGVLLIVAGFLSIGMKFLPHSSHCH